ncbi:T9SS type A sorting domain-containing protein [Flavobacteriales bacterium AH-315-E23]|nr:T9SS type A sorting domain-containing protein [Flavobacteriales bacterium AH-315-E23]
MKKTALIPTAVIIGIFGVMLTEVANTSSPIPPVSRTGAPSEGSCAGCHGNLNTGSGDVIFSLEGLSYIPDSTYSVTVQVVDGAKTRFGFQLTALDSNNNGIGTMIVTNTVNTSLQTNLGREYINHKNANSTDIWSFDWTAPIAKAGPITFYVCGNATNNNGGTSGDNVYTRAYTLETCNLSITDSIAGSYGDSSGIIDITVAGGLAPFTYLWSNGATTEDISNVDSGDFTVVISDSSGCVDSFTINVPFWIGVNDMSNEFALELFPNPSSGVFRIVSHLSNEATNLRVFDLQGGLVYEESSIDSDGTIDLSNLEAGIYTIVLADDEEILYKKVVIQ